MKVLLVYPNFYGINMLPPAIGLFTALLKKHHHTVDLFDTTTWIIPGEEDFDSDKSKEKYLNARPFDDTKLRSGLHNTNVFDDFVKKVTSFNPGLIAVSVTEDMFPTSIRLLKHIRHLEIPVIMGGVFPTFAPELCLSYQEVDMICVGEGGGALVELCNQMEKGLEYDTIKNIWLKKGSTSKKNPIRPLSDINENPVQDFSLFEESRFYRPIQGKMWKMLPVETHRGCTNQCTYCNSPVQAKFYRDEIGAQYFRKKTFHNIRQDLLYFRDVYKADSFYFWADAFLTYNDKEFDEFIELYSEFQLPFYCQIFPNLIKEERIKKLMKVGLFRIGSGIEHGNEEFRKNILKRRVSNSSIIKAFKILNKYDLPFSVNNIIGFPTETRQLAMDSIELNRNIFADSVNAFLFSPFHGTPLRKMAEELGYCDNDLIANSLAKKTVLRMPQFPPGEIEGLRRCFVLYVKMPKNKWKYIEKAEEATPEGDKLWKELKDECASKYMHF